MRRQKQIKQSLYGSVCAVRKNGDTVKAAHGAKKRSLFMSIAGYCLCSMHLMFEADGMTLWLDMQWHWLTLVFGRYFPEKMSTIIFGFSWQLMLKIRFILLIIAHVCVFTVLQVTRQKFFVCVCVYRIFFHRSLFLDNVSFLNHGYIYCVYHFFFLLFLVRDIGNDRTLKKTKQNNRMKRNLHSQQQHMSECHRN